MGNVLLVLPHVDCRMKRHLEHSKMLIARFRSHQCHPKSASNDKGEQKKKRRLFVRDSTTLDRVPHADNEHRLPLQLKHELET